MNPVGGGAVYEDALLPSPFCKLEIFPPSEVWLDNKVDSVFQHLFFKTPEEKRQVMIHSLDTYTSPAKQSKECAGECDFFQRSKKLKKDIEVNVHTFYKALQCAPSLLSQVLCLVCSLRSHSLCSCHLAS